MRKLLAAILCLALAAPSVSFAKGSRGSHSKKSTSTSTKTKKSKKAPSGGIPCADGTTSHAKHTQGACSHHGGIKK